MLMKINIKYFDIFLKYVVNLSQILSYLYNIKTLERRIHLALLTDRMLIFISKFTYKFVIKVKLSINQYYYILGCF